jgi:ketosteroid isomerase-like protein
MSQENVEIVRRVYDAVARRDAETVLSLYDPDVELDALAEHMLTPIRDRIIWRRRSPRFEATSRGRPGRPSVQRYAHR